MGSYVSTVLQITAVEVSNDVYHWLYHDRRGYLQVPRKMLLQMHNLVHTIMKSGRDYGAYHR